MQSKLKDKLILVTGGTRGIGFETSKKLYEQGANLIVTGTKDFTEYKDPFLEKINYVKCDISIPNEINDACEMIKSTWGLPDVLINNAGIFNIIPFDETSESDLDKMMNINFKGSYLTTQLFVKDMLKRGSGKILNVLSVASIKFFPGSSVYCASKAAQRAYSMSLREEVRSKGIDIINVYPGGTETDMWDSSSAHEREGMMMEAVDVADAIVSNLDLSFNERMIIEDVILRPKRGDL